jgi:hypothetical protein
LFNQLISWPLHHKTSAQTAIIYALIGMYFTFFNIFPLVDPSKTLYFDYNTGSRSCNKVTKRLVATCFIFLHHSPNTNSVAGTIAYPFHFAFILFSFLSLCIRLAFCTRQVVTFKSIGFVMDSLLRSAYRSFSCAFLFILRLI